MRILLLAPIHNEKDFLKQEGKLPFLIGQGQQSWVDAFKQLKHEVYVFRYTDSIIIPNFLKVYVGDFVQKFMPRIKNKWFRLKDKFYFIFPENYLKHWKLIDFADKIEPQLIIISGGANCIFPLTIEIIKKKFSCDVLLFSGINPFIASSKIEKIMIKKGILDIVIENDQGYAQSWKKIGAKKTLVLPISSVDPKIHRRLNLSVQELIKYKCDVCFVGTLTKNRQENLAKLKEFNIKIWGDLPSNVGLLETLKPFYFGKAFGKEMVKIFNASKIVLNFQPDSMTHGGNMRSFEIPGCGAFQLADRIDSGWFKDGREYVSFKNIEDLKRKIAYYLQYEEKRETIANNGYKRAHSEHTYKNHFKKIFAYL